MEKTTAIIVPTLNRVETQRTLAEFLPASGENFFLVCPRSEVKEHQSRIKDMGFNATAIAQPSSTKGIGSAREFCLDFAAAGGFEKLLVIDDDMGLLIRKGSTGEEGMRKATRKEFRSAFELMEYYISQGFEYAGMSYRRGNNLVKEAQKINTRQFSFHAYDVCASIAMRKKRTRHRMDAIPVMEDFLYTLDLLSHGVPNIVAYHYALDPSPGGAPGGCSTYRTTELHNSAAKMLKEKHPGFVSLREVDQPTMRLGVRIEPIIQWQKAFKSSGATTPSLPKRFK